MDPAWIVAAISLITLVSGLIIWITRSAWILARRFWSFVEDWEGSPAQHGRAIRPGVLERLGVLERSVSGISEQVNLNSGHSLKDSVKRTEIAVGDLKSGMDRLNTRMDKLTGGSP